MLTSAFLFSGCKKEEEETAETTASTVAGEEGITFAERNYEGAEYRVLCTTQVDDYYVTPEDTKTVINEAVYNRNNDVQNKYGVTLSFNPLEGRSAGRDAFASEIRVSSQNEAYDLIIGQSYYTMAMALEGMYYNFNDSEYLHLDQPWWDKELINDTVDIGGKLYAASGSFVVSQVTTMMGLYFNKTMYNEKQLSSFVEGEDIYQLVRDGGWTYEIMEKMVNSIYEDTNHNEQYDNVDVYGFVGNTHKSMCAMVGSDTPIVDKDDEGNMSISGYYDTHLVDVFDTYLKFFKENNHVFHTASDESVIEYFANSQALFGCMAVEYLASGTVRDSGIDYGILPYPKYDELQESYYTNSLRWEIAHIPATADVEKACIVFEYLNYSTYNNFIPQYYETVLSTQAIQAPEDAEMLALIRSTVRFDFATFYQSQIGNSYSDNIYIGVKTLIERGDSGISSWWDSNKQLYENKLEELVDLYLYYLEA